MTSHSVSVSPPPEPSNTNDPLAPLVEDFLTRAQRGERPTVDEYCDAHPKLADEIRELFPLLFMMQDFSPGGSEPSEDSQIQDDFPERIGGYRIIAEIGRGGMGVVYEAEQESLGRRVALKVLPGQQLAANGRSSALRFQQEARAAAQMHHTNIVPVFEVGEEDGRVFYVMQLIPGQSLDHVIEEIRQSSIDQLNQPSSNAGGARPESTGTSMLQGGLSESGGSKRQRFYRSVAKVGVQVASALAFAHTKGIIHRDIKPGNLMLDAEGVVWVTDFGLAKTEDSGLTQTGDFLGTLRYMPPERFRGQCDERADIYALGLTLYELLLQLPAFGASDRLKLVQQITDGDPPEPRAIDPRIPRDLETILLKTIEKDPKQRYCSARELETDLGRFLNDEPIHARRPSLAEQLVRWTRRNSALAGSLCGLLLLLMAIVMGSTWTAVRQASLRRQADLARQHAEESLYVMQMNLAGRVLNQAAGAGEIRTVTDAWIPLATEPDHREWEWYLLRTHCLEDVLSLTPKDNSTPLDAIWSPDCSQLASAQSDGYIYIWDTETGENATRLERHPNAVVALSWNPLEPLLAACDDNNNIWIWDLRTYQPIHQFKAPLDGLVEQVAWDPAGKRLAWSSNSSVFVVDLDSVDDGAIELTDGPDVITSLQWSPDGEQLAAASWRQQQATIWNATDQKVIRSDLNATLVDWGSEGHKLRRWLLATPLGEVQLYQPGSKDPVRRFVGHTKMARYLSWSPDGKRFVSAASDNSARVWEIGSGASVRVFQGHTRGVLTARFSDDGRRIVSASRDRTARVWDIEPPVRRAIQFPDVLDSPQAIQDRSPTGSLNWQPDGEQLAVVGADGRLRLWSTASGALLDNDQDRWVEQACWSPDGLWLAADELEGASLKHYPGDAYMVNVPGTATIYPRFEEGRTEPILLAHPMRCNGTAWAPGSERIATIASDKKLRVWRFGGDSESQLQLEKEVETGTDEPEQVAWNPQHANVIATSDALGVISVWRDHNRQWTLAGHQGAVNRLAWSCDSEHLASAGQDGTVRVWSLAAGTQVNLLKGHNNAVLDVAWRCGDGRLATAGVDGTVKIWNPQSGSELLSLSYHRSAVLGVAWSPDGQQLATADLSGLVLIWDARAAYSEPTPVEPTP